MLLSHSRSEQSFYLSSPKLVEKIVLQNSAFSGNLNLQNLLILTAIKADPSRVMDYMNRLDNIRSIDRAVEFAFRVEEDGVWIQVAKAQLREGLVSDAIESFICADDATQFLDVIRASEDADVYHDLVR